MNGSTAKRGTPSRTCSRSAFTVWRSGLGEGLFETVLTRQAPSGAIFTTVSDGSEVNCNYPSKDSVYLDGGPGPGAPQHAAGLDDGTYVFQVTDPSGRVLLSIDPAGCRRFVVTGASSPAWFPARANT